jgi:Tol biopolymer transport system component
VLALIGVLWLWRDGRAQGDPGAEQIHFTVIPPDNATVASAAISPNGRRIALATDSAGRTQLWLRALDDVQLRPLAGTEEVTYHFWSPNSSSIGFFAQGKLKTIDVETGTINVVCNATNARGGAWGPNRTILFAAGTGQGLSRVSADGGVPQPQTMLESSRRESSHRWPMFLPGGRHFIYFVRSGDPENTGIYLASLDSSEVRRLVSSVSNAAYAPPGVLLFMRGTALIAQPFDLVKLAMYGEPKTIVDGVSNDPTVFLADFSVSETNVLLFTGGNRNQSQLVWLDRRGVELSSLGPPAGYANVSLSPDGEKVAVAQYVGGASDIWLHDARGGAQSRLTFSPANDMHPVWSPDAQRVVFGSDREGSLNLYMKAASGGKEEVLVSSAPAKYGSDWSRDGRYVVYDAVDPKTKLDVWVVPMSGTRTPMPFLRTVFDEWQGNLSPDGRWMAYTSNESGRYEVYVQSFPDAGETWQISTQGGLHPRWRHDQTELYYINGDQKLVAVPIRTGKTFQHGAQTPLFGTRISRIFAVRSPYAVSKDGQRFLMARLVSGSSPLTVVANWTRRLKQ